MAAKRFRSAFGLATLSDSPAGRHGLMNCKVFKFCAGFQLFSQPNGLRSSSCPLIACLVAIFDRGLSTFNELLRRLFPEPISPLSRESWRCKSLALRLSTFPMSSRSFKRYTTDIEARFALAIFISRKHPRPTGRWKSRGQPGRPRVSRELRELIQRITPPTLHQRGHVSPA